MLLKVATQTEFLDVEAVYYLYQFDVVGLLPRWVYEMYTWQLLILIYSNVSECKRMWERWFCASQSSKSGNSGTTSRTRLSGLVLHDRWNCTGMQYLELLLQSNLRYRYWLLVPRCSRLGVSCELRLPESESLALLHVMWTATAWYHCWARWWYLCDLDELRFTLEYLPGWSCQ